MRKRKIPEPKSLFVERMKKILPDKKDQELYWMIIKEEPVNSIRVNTIKISPEVLIKKLESHGWKLIQPWKNYPEVLIVEGKTSAGKEDEIILENGFSKLEPGELGRTLEHLIGYYYIQELSSMLPVIALYPKENEIYLDLCASPGSKTTQAGAFMKNKGTIIANEISTSGVALGAMQDEIRKYKVENTLLKEEMLKYSSLLYISSAAAKQGFSESKSNFALKKALPIALGQ